MLIEIFTDGKIIIDGEMAGPGNRPERILRDFLVQPEGLAKHKKQPPEARPVTKAA
ncbi:MAG: hypothetical protein HQM09_01930 [Candidatus Riflebacteria bacterium]|nr:hypothetical protein [Candidatus Riflebacteria bacterium]